MLCEYKDVLGVPEQGVHEDRLFGLAFWDLLGMILLIIGLSHWYSYMWIVVPLATVVIHKLFCVDTAFNRFIGL